MTLSLFVPAEFDAAVSAVCAALNLPVRLGGRVVEIGARSGLLYVDTAIFKSCPEWETLISSSVSGGTAVVDGQIVVEAGRTLEFTGPSGVWGPYEIITVEDPAELFAAQQNLP